MRAKIIEWSCLSQELLIGRMREVDVNPISLMDDLIDHRLVLWSQVKDYPTAGTIELREDSKLRKTFPKKFTGVVLGGITHRDSYKDYTILAKNFMRIGNSKTFRDVLKFDNLEDRLEAMLIHNPRLNTNTKIAGFSNERSVRVEDVLNTMLFYSGSLEINRRLIIGGGFIEGVERPQNGNVFIENGRILRNTPLWIEDVIENYIGIPSELHHDKPRALRRYNEQLHTGYSLTWRPDMIVRYIVKTSQKGQLLRNISQEFSRYCVLPDYSAVEYADDMQIIDDPALGNSLFLNLPILEDYHEKCKYVMLAEFKE